MSDQILSALVDSLSAELVKEQPDIKITQERLKQYNQIFGPLDPIIKELHNSTVFDKIDRIFKHYTQELFISRPDLSPILKQLEIVPINSRSHSSLAYKYKDKSFVIIDTITMQFIWMMNKAFLCRFNDQGDPTELFAKLYLHFATVIGHKHLNHVYEKPKTPPHKDAQSLFLLSLMTKIQEKFLLAHEIAHLVITENTVRQHKQYHSSFTASIMQGKSTPAIDTELAVDKMAFDLVHADMKREYPKELVDFGCEMVFLLIRYFIWLRVVIHLDDSEEDAQFNLWLARNRQLRKIFSEDIKSDFLNDGILQMLDYLEGTQEIGAMAAHQILKKQLPM